MVAGAFLINVRRSGEGGGRDAPATVGALGRAMLRRPGALLMVLVAACWALAGPLDKMALEAAGAAQHGFVLCAGVAAIVFALLAARGRVGEVREIARAPVVFAVALVLSAFALTLQLLAIHLVWVSLVETLKRGFGNLAALVYGRFLFGEAITGVRVAGVAMITAGVALILV